jgi:hypothetical protein
MKSKFFAATTKDVIVNSFRKVGLSLIPDGSADYDIKIRDLPGIEVGDSPDTIIVGI